MKTRRIVGIILAVVVLIIVLWIIFFIWFANKMNAEEPPGVGAKSEKGYQVCAPIIAALDRYKAEKGAYPSTLDALVPLYLPSLPNEVNNEPLLYNKIDISYSLEFSYSGPGMNHCAYTPETKWKCMGFY